MQTPPQFDPNEEISVTITKTANQWNEFLAFLDSGPHRIVRSVIDMVTSTASAHMVGKSGLDDGRGNQRARRVPNRKEDYQEGAINSDA